MQPHDFIRKWSNSKLKESASSKSHFDDLCALLDIEKPADADPNGTWFTFEKGAKKTGGGDGWADVWRRGSFAWEYKGKNKDLDRALAQLLQYSSALENPPLLVVSDMYHIRIHTNWTNTVQQVYAFTIDDLADGATRDLLRNAFLDPDALKPTKTRQALTEDAAKEFAAIAQRLRSRDHNPHTVAHFVNRLVFCMFAEDVRLLPDHMFTKMLNASRLRPERFELNAQKLFRAMATGGDIDFTPISWFNGGLFDDDTALPLERDDIENLIAAADLDWSEIDPSILGTLFERGLDPDKRSQLGAHYTDREKIMQIIEPVVIAPLQREWATIRLRIDQQMEKVAEAKARVPEKQSDARKVYNAARRAEELAYRNARELHGGFIDKLRAFRVLDPACGSGNFLYLSLLALKDIEHRANLDAEVLGLGRPAPVVGPECVLGIELNPYAAELARVSVWIGEIQWMRRNGFAASTNPILRTLDNIEQRNAIVNDDGSAAAWPVADVIVGNPPFLGAKLMKRKLGVDETAAIRTVFDGKLPNFTDLVCYWFENARAKIETGECKRAGFVATNSIRKNTNLPVMNRISQTTRIFEAWPEQKWSIDGAAVDVSLVCFGECDQEPSLNGQTVDQIHPDLTTGLNLTLTRVLPENADGAFLGIQKSGPFDVPGEIARRWMSEPVNPNGIPNSAILKPYWNGDDVTSRPRDVWLIDLPLGLSESNAAFYEKPFEYIQNTVDENGKTVKQLRAALGERAGPRWWEPHWPRQEMRSRIAALSRYIVTPETSAHRLFIWQCLPTLPDKNLIVIPRDDDTTFGILHSRFHELWALRKGSDLQDRPRYTHTSVFTTFPFPEGLGPNIAPKDYENDTRAQAIAAAAKHLDDMRRNWLNPADLVVVDTSVVPNRIVPRDDSSARELAKRTLTNLYNDPPTWLRKAHASLDATVAVAYGWGQDWNAGILDDNEILTRLFDLNQQRTQI